MRMDAENQTNDWAFSSSWFISERLRSFVQTAAPGLYSVLCDARFATTSLINPFKDAALLEAHGEEYLELLINKAPDKEWM